MSNGMTATTGPKISSRASGAELSTSANTVGEMKNPSASSPPKRSPPVTSRVSARVGRFDHAQDAVGRSLVDHRSEERRRRQRITDLKCAEDALHQGQHFFVDRPFDENTGAVDATLPAALHAEHRLHRGIVEVRVGEDDVGRLAAEFQADGLEDVLGGVEDPLGGGPTASEVDLVDPRVGDHCLAAFRACGHDVEHTGRKCLPRETTHRFESPNRVPTRAV